MSQVCQVSEVMKAHPEFCNLETRVPDLLYILKKYNYDEIVVVDSDRHPLGIVQVESVSDRAMKNTLHPFDVKAGKLMKSISATVKQDASFRECLKVMENNHLNIVPVVDDEGHCLGLVKKEDLTRKIRF